MAKPESTVVVVSTRRLLYLVQTCDAVQDQAVRTAADSLRSWLVYTLRYRTTELPPALVSHYNFVTNYTTENAHDNATNTP